MKPSWSAGPAARTALVVLCVLLHAASSRATTYNVFTPAGLVSAVTAANATLGPDIINLAPGHYSLLTQLDVTDDLTLNGAGRPGTFLEGNGLGGSAFSIHHSFTGDPNNSDIHATFNDLTLQDFHYGIDFSSGPASLLLVNRSTVAGCTGDGFDVGGGPVQILNSTISGNRRGMLIETGDSLLLDNVTIAQNATRGVEKYGGPVTVHNSIIAYNGTDCSGQPNLADHNVAGDGTCGPGFITGDPLLGVLSDNGGPSWTYALAPGSVAIDAGSGGQPTDQRGVPRPQGAAVDIGSFEWTAVAFKAVTGTLSAGGSVSTDTLATGATPTDPVQTSVTAPNGGNITIEQGPGAAEFGFIGQSVQITAVPDATPANPFTIVFVIDASAIPSGQSAATIVVKKNGVVVPPCTGLPGTASPDACVSNRQTIAGSDAQITVLSSTASTWDFAPGGTASVPDQPARVEFSISPSPIRHDAQVSFTLPTAASVDLSLFDLTGRKVGTLVFGRQPAGRYSLAWHDAERLPAGVYFARFRAGSDVRTTTIVRVN